MAKLPSPLNLFFFILSVAYIAGIFLFADSPVVSDIAAFNPYSLLHIPLYGILTILLILSFPRPKRKVINPTSSIDSINSTNSMKPTNSINSTNLLVAGVIALIVAVADEIHQSFIPWREASVTDVFLDLLGILLALFLIPYLYRKKKHSTLSLES